MPISRPLPTYECARVRRVLGDEEAALEWLERAVGKGLRWPANAAPDPDLAILKDDPRYEALRKKMASR
ncbi:MAG: TPR end-of-group domain-containing protein [Planctomycetota bacterium]